MNCCKQKVQGSISIVNSPVQGNISDVLSITGNISLDQNIINQDLSQIQTLSAELTPINNLNGELSPIEIISGLISATQGLPTYKGVYEVTPLPYIGIQLQTAHTRLNQDIIINEIPYYQTSNESGGYTVIIG